MRIRTVLQEWEAQLEPIPSSPFQKARAKAEWKIYGDGSRKCKLFISNLGLPDDTLIDIHVNGRLIAQTKLEKGSARFRRETEQGEQVSEVNVKDVMQILNAGRVFLEGRFYEE
jgi:hypothetical protein